MSPDSWSNDRTLRRWSLWMSGERECFDSSQERTYLAKCSVLTERSFRDPMKSSRSTETPTIRNVSSRTPKNSHAWGTAIRSIRETEVPSMRAMVSSLASSSCGCHP